MTEIKEPWKLDTNNKYSEVVKTIMGFSTASLFLPIFFVREFLGIKSSIPLASVLDCSIYWAWFLLGLSLLAGVIFLYLSAKWVRLAWGKEAGILWSSNTKESWVEASMELAFWSSIAFFSAGLILTLVFFVNYSSL